jgi:hypothetical protein
MRRRRTLLVVLAVALAARMALPAVLRPIFATRAGDALQAEVTIGDLDLGLLRGRVVLEDVAVRPRAAAGAAAPQDTESAVAWKRLAVGIRWLPLLGKTVRLRELRLESPRVALDRRESGQLSLLSFGRGEAPPAPAETASEPPPAKDSEVGAETEAAPEDGWEFGLDRLVLRDGRLRFRDFTVRETEPVDVTLEAVDVEDVALRPGVYGEPARLHVRVGVEEGWLLVDGSLALGVDGVRLAADVKAKALPLRRTRVYVPEVGWSTLQGRAAARLRYRFETGARHDVYGTLRLDDVVVTVPGLEESALAVRRFAVSVLPLDLARQRAAVGTVELVGATLPVRVGGGDLLPVLARPAPPEASAPGPPAAAAPPPDVPAGPSWRWSVGRLHLADSRLVLLGPLDPVEVGVALDAARLSGEGEAGAPVRLALALGGGALTAEGTARLDSPGFEGSIVVERVALPEIVAAAGLLPPHVLQKGTLDARLTLALGPPAGDLRVGGTLAVAEPWVAAADPWEFAFGAREVAVDAREVHVPGVLGQASTAGAAVRLAALRLATPYLQLTREAAGLVLPPLSAPASAAAPGGPAAPAPPPAADGEAAASPLDLEIGTLRVAAGRVGFVDRTVKPFYYGELTPLEVEADAVRWPPPATERLRVVATAGDRGRVEVAGKVSPTGGRLEVNGRQLSLIEFNPYANAYSPYTIGRGRLTLSSRATFGDGRYRTDSAITLADFDLRGSDARVQEALGVPLTVALALLRDVRGRIVLDVPVEVDRKGTSLDLSTVVLGALRRALVNALASPLKLLGAVVGSDQAKIPAPAPILFRPGRAVLAADGEAQVLQLGTFLAGRPAVAVRLMATPAPSDERWLREQALREQLGGRGRVLGALRDLRHVAARERIRRALEARARDEEAPLEPDDAALLDEMLAEAPPLAADRLPALAEARLARVEMLLRERQGIGADRAMRGTAAAPPEEPPAVRVELAPAERS